MKQFEKIFPDSKNNSGSQITIARKESWKAALEWIKYAGVISDKELAGKLINEELEDAGCAKEIQKIV